MDNNQNENLSPEELVEKLKEKLALDNTTYSKMLEQTFEEDDRPADDMEFEELLESLTETHMTKPSNDIIYEDEDISDSFEVYGDEENIDDVFESEDVAEISSVQPVYDVEINSDSEIEGSEESIFEVRSENAIEYLENDEASVLGHDNVESPVVTQEDVISIQDLADFVGAENMPDDTIDVIDDVAENFYDSNTEDENEEENGTFEENEETILNEEDNNGFDVTVETDEASDAFVNLLSDDVINENRTEIKLEDETNGQENASDSVVNSISDTNVFDTSEIADLLGLRASEGNSGELGDTDDEYINQTIALMLSEITDDDTVADETTKAPEDGILSSDVGDTEPSELKIDESNAAEFTDETESTQAEVFESKPKKYKFKRYDPNAEKNIEAVSDVAIAEEPHTQDACESEEKEQAIPELEKPDLKVMQTFGASVEHIRELYGDSVADEYEKVLAESDFNERQAVENEYTSAEQNLSIISGFKEKIAKLKIKIIISAIMCALMLLIENISVVDFKFGGILDSDVHSLSYIMIDLQFLLVCAALALPILKRGIADIVSFEPSSKSITFAIFVVALIVDIATCFVDGAIVLYNFCAGTAILFSLIYELQILKRDYMTFKIVSSEKTKHAAVVGIGTSKSPEVAAYEELDEGEEVKIISIKKGKFIKDFFARTKQSDSCTHDKILLPLTVAAMVIVFVVSLVVHKDASNALKIANMSFSVIVPFAVYFSLAFPVFKASESVYENGAAIVGDAALEEYSGSSIICFEDREVFPSYCVKLKSVKVYGESRIDRILYNASSVFSKLGGPLSDVFSLSTIEIGTSDDVEIILCDNDGIEAKVDGKRILVGKSSFLAKYDIFARKDESDKDDYCHMYVAEDDFLCAKFYIKYSLDVDFENVMVRMSGCGICAALKTFDPNINDIMLSKFIDTKKYPVRVIRNKVGEDIAFVQEEVNSGVISTSGAKSTIDATVTCERLYNIRSSSNTVKILSMIIGLIICGFITAFNVTPFCSVFVVLYQLLWMIPNLISSRIYLNR